MKKMMAIATVGLLVMGQAEAKKIKSNLQVLGALCVAKNIRFNTCAGAQNVVGNPLESLRVFRGYSDSDGTHPGGGLGYTVARDRVGVYTVTFSQPFLNENSWSFVFSNNAPPTVSATPVTGFSSNYTASSVQIFFMMLMAILQIRGSILLQRAPKLLRAV